VRDAKAVALTANLTIRGNDLDMVQILLRLNGKFAVSATALASLTLSAASAADTLRVCSDPDNLPFSKSEGADKGLYIELAELVGKRLGTPVEYVWWLSFNQRRALRTTMDGCDAYFALPADAQYPSVAWSRAMLSCLSATRSWRHRA